MAESREHGAEGMETGAFWSDLFLKQCKFPE